MNIIKQTTFLDRCKNAVRAFQGKPIGSISFGIDVKKCSECDKENGVAYLCNQRRCGEKCTYPTCKHTTDIRYAKNFEIPCNESGYWEKENSDV